MGKLIKINIYVDRKVSNSKKIDMILLEDNFIAYKKWLSKMNKSDIIESYKIFLSTL